MKLWKILTGAEPEGHTPPHDLDAEASLLGACLVSSNALPAVCGEVDSGDFYRESHSHIWASMLKLLNEGKQVDSITLGAQLEREGILEGVGGKAFIRTLSELCPVASHVHQYAGIVRELAIRRKLIRATQETLEEAYSGGELDELMDHAEERIYGVQRRDVEDRGVDLRDMAAHAVERLDSARAGKRTAGHPTTYVTLDNIIGGLAPGNLSILAARPSQGKTALAINIAQAVAAEHPVAVFSLEMTRDEIHERMFCAESLVGITKLHLGIISNAEYVALFDGITRVSALDLHIDDSSGLSLATLRSKLRRVAAKNRPDLVIVDYLQLMGGDGSESRNYELANITRGMKQMAREYHTHIMALSQLRRPDQMHRNSKPKLQDLRDSGAIEQDADLVISLYRPEPDPENPQAPQDVIDVDVLKHRTGAIGGTKMKFIPDYTLFKEIIA